MITLKNYYKTKHWRELRRSYVSDTSCCAICGAARREKYKIGKKKGSWKPKVRRLNLHHKSYDNLYHEKGNDLILVCTRCHNLGHSLELASRSGVPIFQEIYSFFKASTPWDYKRRPNAKL